MKCENEEFQQIFYKDFPLMSSLNYHVYWDTQYSKYKPYNDKVQFVEAVQMEKVVKNSRQLSTRNFSLI